MAGRKLQHDNGQHDGSHPARPESRKRSFRRVSGKRGGGGESTMELSSGGTYGLMGPLTLSRKSSILLVCFLMESSAVGSSTGAGDPNWGPAPRP